MFVGKTKFRLTTTIFLPCYYRAAQNMTSFPAKKITLTTNRLYLGFEFEHILYIYV